MACAVAVFAACWLAGLACRRIVPLPPARQRDRWLDGLRGLAALCVLASHYGTNVAGSLGFAVTPVFHNLGTFGVQVFFAITGYLFTRKAISARGHLAVAPFLSARLRRIVPMYSVAILLAVALAVLTRPFAGAAHLLRETIALYAFGFVLEGAPTINGLPYTDVIGTIWTLPFEWLFYLFVPVLAVLVPSWRSLAVTAVVLAAYYGNRMWDGGAEMFTPFFLPGVLLGLLPNRPPSGVPRRLLAATALALALLAILPGSQNFTAARLLLMCGFFAAIVFAAPDSLAWPGVAMLGDISYSVYLLHFPALFAARAVFDSPGVALFAPWPRTAALLAVAALVILLSAVTFRVIERPFLRRV